MGWMRAMTPSPMRTMAAKCFARVGVVMSMLIGGVLGGGVLSVGGVGRRNVGGQDDREEQAMALTQRARR
jgi:hypothetical protein